MSSTTASSTISSLLNEAQKNAGSHGRLLKACRTFFAAPEAVLGDVVTSLCSNLDLVLSAKQSPVVDRLIAFTAQLCSLSADVVAPAILEVRRAKG